MPKTFHVIITLPDQPELVEFMELDGNFEDATGSPYERFINVHFNQHPCSLVSYLVVETDDLAFLREVARSLDNDEIGHAQTLVADWIDELEKANNA